MGIYDWTTFLLSLVYVLLAAKSNRWCFPFAFVASLIWAYTSFFLYNLKFDGFLQLFYCVMAIVGWYSWNNHEGESNSILRLEKKQHYGVISIGVITSILLVLILKSFTNTNLPYLDSTTTVFSVLATFMLIYRYIDTWIYLFICNLMYIYIYYSQGAYAFSIIMIIYSVLAIHGYLSWKSSKLYARYR